MRKVVAVLTIVVAIACLCGPAQPAPVWTDVIEGGAVADPWSFFSQRTGNTVDTIIIDAGTLNRALVLTDYSDDGTFGKAQIQRPNWRDGPNGVTLHCRFMVVSGSEDGAIGIQIPEGQTGGDTNGLIKWAWYSANGGEMRLAKPDQPGTNFPALADTWVEIWQTISGGGWKLWVKSGGSWTVLPQLQGTLALTKAGIPYIGSGNFPAWNAQMEVDFARIHIVGAYGPNDPDRPVLPDATSNIGTAKVTHPLGFPESFPNKMVTSSWTQDVDARFCNVLYIQDDSRAAGVRVQREIQNVSEKVAVGARVDVKGFFDRTNQEVKVMVDELTIATAAPVPPVLPGPLWVLGKNVSAGSLGLQTAYSPTSVGLNNAGLRVRTYGVVTATGKTDPVTGFVMSYIDDGTGMINDSYYWYLFDDPSGPFPGIKVYNATGLNVGDKVAVSGSAGVEQYILDPSVYYPVIYCATPSDVSKY